MARMPGTRWLGEHSPKRPMDRYDIVCVHTIVGYAPAHAAHFSVHGDGRIDQSRDTRYQSAANLDGNHRVIAIENEDTGPDFGKWPASDNAPKLTDAQVHANARILAWAHETHGIPLQLCPNSRPTSRGLGWHRQGIDGNFGGYRYPGRVSGGETWTESFGKVCPTDNRIAQCPEILAAAKGGTTERDWFDMATEQDLKNAVNEPWMETSSTLNADGTRSPKTVRQLLVLGADRSLKAARDAALALAEVRAVQRGDVLDDAAREQIAADVDQVLANQQAAIEEEV